jgi:alpha-amylase
MTTKPSNVGLDRGIYSSPFDAFTNYMNILGDFLNRVHTLYPDEIDNDELNSLLTTIRNQGEEIEMKEKEILRLQTKIEKIEAANEKLHEKIDKAKAPAKKAPAKKAPAKKAATKTEKK